MFCSNCGQSNVGGARFCNACGRALGSPASDRGNVVPIPESYTGSLSQVENRNLVEGLVSAEAKRRESAIRAYANTPKRDSRIENRIEELARNDPIAYVREAALKGLGSKGVGNSQRTAYYQTVTAAQRELTKEAGRKDIGRGLRLFVVGLVLTIVSLFTTTPGGTFVVFSGALVFGGYFVLRAIQDRAAL